MSIAISQIDIASTPAVLDLLQTSGLEVADIDVGNSTFLVAHADGALAGVIGLERRGAAGLVRSMAVSPALRRRGIARALYAEAEREARQAGLIDLYALTETAEAFFRRAGYARIDRSSAPPEIATTAQFASLCPASAAVMHRSLIAPETQS